MAKSKKKKADDEEEKVEEQEVEEEPTEDDVAEVKADDAEEAPADDAEADADVADVDEVKTDDEIEAGGDDDEGDKDDDKDNDEEASIDEAPSAPSPKITTTALVLIFLNIIMSLAVLTLAVLDHVQRTKDSYRTVINYAKVWGLPLKEEDEGASISSVTRPVNRLTSEQLAKAFAERRTGKSVGSDKFQNIEEDTAFLIRPSDMSENVVKDLFWDLQNPVKTLDEEIERLKTAIPTKISEAATEVAETLLKKPEPDKRKFARDYLAISGDAAQTKAIEEQIGAASGAALDDFVKRAIVHRTLFTIAFNVFQVDELDKKLTAAKGAELDKLVSESIQRRLYYDILAPINVYRPGEMSDSKTRFEIEKMADPKVSLDDIKKMLEKRLDAAIAPQYLIDVHLGKEFWDSGSPTEAAKTRDAIEKRKHIGFILFTLGQVNKPLIGAKLFDKGVERAQVVCGLNEFTNASLAYVNTIDVLDGRIARAAEASRQGWLVVPKDGKQEIRTPGFIDIYELEVDRLVKIRERIAIAEKRLGEVKKQRDQFNTLYDERAKQYKDALDRLLTERKNTEKLAKDLRELQVQLHEALVNLAEAGERNFQIEAEIRAIELEYIRKSQPKGAKK
jgi:hypothetical protein